MLQWMGGSRRKVNASRNSTLNRQRQYFEQRKRQQQARGGGNWVDSGNKHLYGNVGPRSLDILSLTNLATLQGNPPSINASHVSKISSSALFDETIHRHIDNLDDTGSGQSAPAKEISENSDGSKVSKPVSKISNGKSSRPMEQANEVETPDFSVLDLLSDEGPASASEGKYIPEEHVAFSVEGLGGFRMETPFQSQNLNTRRVSYMGSSPSMKTSARFKSPVKPNLILHELGLECGRRKTDFRMSDTGRPMENLSSGQSMIDDMDKIGKEFLKSSVKKDFYPKMSRFDSDGLDTYLENGKEQELDPGIGILQDNFFVERQYGQELKDNIFYAESCPSLYSNAEILGCDYQFGDPDLYSSRRARKPEKRLEFTGKLSPFRHFLSDKDDDFISLHGKRNAHSDDCLSFGAINSSHAWPFSVVEDAEDSTSLLSEESCSSTAVKKGRPHNSHAEAFGSRQNKNRCTKNPGFSSKRSYDRGNFFTDAGFSICLGGHTQRKNINREENCTSPYKRRSFGASLSCNEYSMCQETLEKEVVPLFDEGYSTVRAPFTPDALWGTTQENAGPFTHELLAEDNNIDNFTIQKNTSNIKFSSSRENYNFVLNHEPLDKFIHDNEKIRSISFDCQSENPVVHPSKPQSNFPDSPCDDFFWHNRFEDLSRWQEVIEDEGGASRSTFEESKYDASLERESLHSVNSKPVEDTNCKEIGKEQKITNNHEKKESLDCQDTTNPPGEVENTPSFKRAKSSAQHESSVGNKLNQLHEDSPVPSDAAEKGSKDANNNSDTSYQVMLESYVLQLLCVQKVLLDASEKDVREKIIMLREEHLVHLRSSGVQHDLA